MAAAVPGRACLAAAALLVAACSSPQLTASQSELEARIPFLRAGSTRLSEVNARLGEPFGRHDADRVYVWRAAEDADGRLRIANPRAATAAPGYGSYDIVLEFDGQGVMSRGSLVHAE